MVEGFKVCENAVYLNSVCNHPEVNSGNGVEIDVSPLLESGIAYQFDGGGIVYVELEPGIYEAHTQALKRGRGKVLREFIALTLEDLFLKRAAKMVCSYAHHTNPAAKKLASEFLNFLKSENGCDYFTLEREDYLCR